MDIMFSDTAAEQCLILAEGQPSRSSAEHTEQLSHLKSVLKEGSFYAIQQPPSSGRTSYVIVQLLAFNPAGKKYMQKVMKWTDDPWFEKLGVVMLGTATADQEVIACDDDDAHDCPLPDMFSCTSIKRCPTELTANAFFGNNFDGVYELTGVDYQVAFAWDAVSDILDQEYEFAIVDVNFLTLVLLEVCMVLMCF